MRVDGKSTQYDVHNVILLDASASMDVREKYHYAKLGVLKEVELCKELGYTLTLIEFVQSGSIARHYFKTNPDEIQDIRFAGPIGRNTPLYSTIINTLSDLLVSKGPNDKFLVKVMTDGQNNVNDANALETKMMIDKMISLGHTVTFICTNTDVLYITGIGVDESNITTHDNTGESVNTAFKDQYEASIRYDKRMRSGEDVTRGFYKKINE